jgi:hypothetical protein
MKKLIVMVMAACAMVAQAQQASEMSEADKAAELAKQLANPVANLISVPVQYNYADKLGLDDEGTQNSLVLQPVIPLGLNEDWLVITRTIIPFLDRSDFPIPGKSKSGLGDIVASQYFSPKEPTASGLIWGVGPAELLPTATDELLGGEKWGAGPTVVALKQSGPWTVGFLGNHMWSVAGDDDRADVNATFLQPFVSYITKTHTTLGLLTETTYDWENEQWTIPVLPAVAQMLKVGPQIMQLMLAGTYYAESPEAGPEGWGARVQLTFLFPK